MNEADIGFLSGGRSIHGTLRRAEGSAAALLVHGFGSFRDELTGYIELADRLAAVGISSLRIDMSGCGESGIRGTMKPKTRVDRGCPQRNLVS